MDKIRVMIVDDSAVVRQTLKEVLESTGEVTVEDTAPDPLIAKKKLELRRPQVIILDIEMPRMDGLTFLKEIMDGDPLPVIICSTQSGPGSQNALTALELGATDILEKPKFGTKEFLEESRTRFLDAVKAAAVSRRPTPVKKLPHSGAAGTGRKIIPHQPQPKLTADAVLPEAGGQVAVETTEKVVVVGASTGGTEALKVFLEAYPADAPGTVVVQHMPEKFTEAFAQRLNGICKVTVKEARNMDPVLRGQVLIAPGNKHTLLKRTGSRYFVEVQDGPLVSRHRPSVDVLFRSAARYAGANALGVIMTGMGDDGARGMKELKNAGAYNYAQNEESCVVFGMPQEAIKQGGVDEVLPLEELADAVMKKFNRLIRGMP